MIPAGHKVGCTGKKQFTHFGDAHHVAKRVNRRDQGSHVEAYHCRHCRGFHVGEARSYGRRKKVAEA